MCPSFWYPVHTHWNLDSVRLYKILHSTFQKLFWTLQFKEWILIYANQKKSFMRLRIPGWIQNVTKHISYIANVWNNFIEKGRGGKVLVQVTVEMSRVWKTKGKRNYTWALHSSWQSCFSVLILLCMLKLNSQFNSERMVGGRLLTVGVGVTDKQGKEVRMTHVIMDQSWRQQNKLTFSLI